VDRYAQQAAELAEELASSLTEREVQFLRERFEAATLASWRDWQAEAADDVRAFVRATPAQRRRRKRWAEALPLLTHAAYLHCVQAHAMLHAVSQHDLTPGGSYRDAAARAGDAYQTAQRIESDFPEWPWDGESPIPCE
tara:strand:- start:11459 stop:11875 length:417 start_codon:yes stop_codon:yes gene_type:complete